jgi:hypothetical protein
MNQNEVAKDAEGSPGLVATNRVEAIVAALLLVFGAVIMVESRKLGAGWTSDGPGAGYFPFYIGLILVIASAGTLVLALVGKHRNTGAFVDREQLKRVLQVLLPAAVYVAVVSYLGLYVASAIYIALFMALLGHYPWLKSVLTGVAVNALMFAMFEVWFKVPLFKGRLDPLAFLGY